MTTTVADPVLAGYLEDLLACLVDAAGQSANPPAHAQLRPGIQIELMLSTTRDECCEGLAWVRPTTYYPSATFPQPDTGWNNCAPLQWAAVLEMGIARCAPVPAANELTPDQEWTDLTKAILDDAAAMRRALCCFDETHPDLMHLAGQWQPLAIEGGCVGGTQLVTVAFGACDCDD